MISVLIPTRKRPEQLRRAIESAKSGALTCPEFCCYIDDDDNSYLDEWFRQDCIKFLHRPRITLSDMWNKCAEIATGEILLQGNDDIIFRTLGWDKTVEDAFAESKDKILMVHGSDGSKGLDSSVGKFGPHPFVHRKWYETLGYFTPPFFSSDYGDTWLNDLANALGRRKYIPIVIEHMHMLFGKAVQDETTDERLKRGSIDKVDQLYKDLACLRELDVEKLKAAMQ